MLHKASDILKRRWPEVALVVVISAGLTVLFERVLAEQVNASMMPQAGHIPGWAMIVLGVGCMLMAVVGQMLYMGFLRTAALDGAAPHEPMTLLQTGRGFFWRYLWMQLVLGAAIWLTVGLLGGAAAAMLGYPDINAAPMWLLQAVGVVSVAILAKPVILTPSFMLAMDIPASQAFVLMLQTRLGELGGLPKMYAAGLSVIAAVSVLTALLPEDTSVFYIAAIVSAGVQCLVMLMLILATILFIVGEPVQTTEETEEATEG